MSDDIFYPIPAERKRGILRWILMASHALLFAGVVFGYPQLEQQFPEIFADNMVRLGITAWGVAVVAHLLLVALLDVREGIVRARVDRRRRDEYRTLRRTKRRETLKEKTRGSLAVADSPNEADLFTYDDTDYLSERQHEEL